MVLVAASVKESLSAVLDLSVCCVELTKTAALLSPGLCMEVLCLSSDCSSVLRSVFGDIRPAGLINQRPAVTARVWGVMFSGAGATEVLGKSAQGPDNRSRFPKKAHEIMSNVSGM